MVRRPRDLEGRGMTPTAPRLYAPTAAVPTVASRLSRAVPSAGVLLAAASALLIGLWVLAHLWYDARALRAFDDHMGDGPFQLFNPLRRIAAGQVGGVDFQYFHGLALPYLHYPIYALAGGDFYASEVARYSLSQAAYLGAFLFVFGCATRRVGPTLALTALALVATERIAHDSLALPGVNLIGLRATCPLLAVGVLLAGFRPSREAVATGALAGVGFTLGTDHGIAAALMLGVVWLGRGLFGLPGGRVRYLGYTVLAAASSAAGVLLAIGGPAGALGALKYALVELPADQFWFFGVPPNKFLHYPRQLFSERYLLPALVAPAAAAVALAGWVRRRPEARPVGVVLLGAMVYSLASCVGYFGYCSSHYLNPAYRVLVVAGLVAGWHALAWLAHVPEIGPAVERAGRWALAGFLLVFILIGPTTAGRSSVLEARAAAVETRDWAREGFAGRCPLGPRFRSHLDVLTAAIDADRAAAGVTRSPVIWSTYAGVLEAHYGVSNPGGDYLIHAVGPARRAAYLAAFRAAQPDYVCTFRRSVWPWEECLQNNDWDFYEDLVRNYEPLADSWAFRLWKRVPGAWQVPDDDWVSLAPDRADLFTVPVPSGLSPGAGLVVEVEYEAKSPARGVPVVGGLPRFLLHPHDCENVTPISLPPYRDRWAFAVYPTPGQTPSFYAGTASFVGGKVIVKGVRVRPIRAAGRERFLHDEPLAKLP